MSALAYQQNGYVAATRKTGMPRSIEYQLFSKTTGRLNRASQPDGSFPDLAEALSDNLELWRTLAVDVVDDENGLPAQLRAQLLYLFEFTNAHTSKVLRGEADVSALIDINTSIMKGLRQSPQEEGTP
ncbi:MAG: flagellar biosynthesis regulator FlaF [Pseudomonadota bacterium]